MINKNRIPSHCKHYIEKPRYGLVLYYFLKMKIPAHTLHIQFQCSKNISYQGWEKLKKIQQQKSEFNSKVLYQHLFMGWNINHSFTNLFVKQSKGHKKFKKYIQVSLHL